MPTVKRLVCLANSRKLSGRCVAGIEVAGDRRIGWVRPVSAREHEEVAEDERRYEDGSEPRVLDVVDVPVLGHRPREYQQENWLLDPKHYWRQVGFASWEHVLQLIDPVDQLWAEGDSTHNGLNDRVAAAAARQFTSSLRLVHVSALKLWVGSPGEAFGDHKRRLQARFRLGDLHYHLWVTDPDYEGHYLALPDGVYDIGESALTVSLSEEHNGSCYKLVAAIIERSRA
jgi:hypothetical protein